MEAHQSSIEYAESISLTQMVSLQKNCLLHLECEARTQRMLPFDDCSLLQEHHKKTHSTPRLQ